MRLIRGLLALLLVSALAAAGCKKDAAPAPSTGEPAPAAPAAAEPTPSAPAEPAKPATGVTPAELARRFPHGQNCSPEAVAAALTPINATVRACFQTALARDPDAGGKMVVQVTVSGEGRASEVKVSEDEIRDPALAGCLIQTMHSAAYAPSPPDRPCTFEHPFDFQASPEVRAKLRTRK